MEIVGTPASGRSSGEAMQAMEELAGKLPAGMGYEWTGQSYEERLSGSQAPMLYALSLIVVFLCLAALYESWSIPTAVLLVVPLGIVGALAATSLRGLSNDVYFKVGFLTIIGLSTKNAILIVEFAKDAQARGLGLIEATLEAVHLRLRPILMTSFAFILGVTPLAVAWGAGSASQNAIGTGVIGGMITATVLAIFLVPVFYVVVRKYSKAKPNRPWLPQKPESNRPPVPPKIQVRPDCHNKIMKLNIQFLPELTEKIPVKPAALPRRSFAAGTEQTHVFTPDKGNQSSKSAVPCHRQPKIMSRRHCSRRSALQFSPAASRPAAGPYETAPVARGASRATRHRQRHVERGGQRGCRQPGFRKNLRLECGFQFAGEKRPARGGN